MLTETSPELLDAVAALTGFQCEILHTGGGCMVLAIDLSEDGRLLGKQVWLTREEDWIIGFYDFETNPEDEGICLSLMTSPFECGPNDEPAERENPEAIAYKVDALLHRLGVGIADNGVYTRWFAS